MKSKYITIVLCLIVNLSYSQSFEWAKQIGGEGLSNVTMTDVVATNNDGVFIVGSFSGTIDFDPSNIENNSVAIATDGFAARYNSEGNLVWVYTTNTSGNEEISAATYSNAMGLDILNIVVKIGNDAFAMRALNTTDGSLFTSSQLYYNQGATLNINGINKNFSNEETAFYIVGSFAGLLQLGNIQIENSGYTDAFCIKFTVTNSNWFALTWAKRFGTESNNEANDVVINGQNTHPVIVGGFYGTIDFGSGSIHTSGGNKDAFAVALNSSDGSILATNAAFTFGSTADEVVNSIYRSEESFSPILIGGKFGNTVDFEPENGISNLTASGSYDGFLASYTISPANDYSLNWAKKIGETYQDEVIDAVYNTNVYFAARFQNSSFGTSIYLGSLDSNGNNRAFGGQLVPNLINSQNYVTGLEMNNSNELFCAGIFGVETDFDPDAGVYNLYPVGNAFDAFIQKMSGNTLNSNEFDKTVFVVYPNPSQSYFELAGSLNIEKVEIYSMNGQLIKTFERQNQYAIYDLAKGNYIIKVTALEGTISKTLHLN